MTSIQHTEDYPYFESIEECNAQSITHEHYGRIVQFNQEYVNHMLTTIANPEELDTFQQYLAETNPNHLSRVIFNRFPYDILMRQFTEMRIDQVEYDALMNGNKFIIPTHTGGSGYSSWELFRMPNGLLYFIIRVPIPDTMWQQFRYSVQIVERQNIELYNVLFDE
jgi:hypothetical protein